MSRRIGIRGAITLIVGSICLLLLLTGTFTVSANGHKTTFTRVQRMAALSIQDTPTVDPTLTTLQKEQLVQQIKQLNSQNTWAWTAIGSVGGIIGGLGTILLAIVGYITVKSGFNQWRGNREDDQIKRGEEQTRWLDDRQREREKRDEERFQTAVSGLGSESKETKIGAAIILRTFLEPGYERFHRQIFDLAVAYLRLQKVPPDASKPFHRQIFDLAVAYLRIQKFPSDASKPLDSLSQALVTLFKESFPRVFMQASSQDPKFNPESLNATGIHLDKAYLRGVNLTQVWMPDATLRYADLTGIELSEANLTGTDFSLANLQEATLARANLTNAIFTDADLTGADLTKATLAGTHPETAKSLEGAQLIDVIDFDDPSQREACEKRGANFVVLSTQSSTTQPTPNTS